MRTITAALILLAPGWADSATFTVTRNDDPLPDACLAGDCSLREAVNAASTSPDADFIVLGGGIYFLTRADATPGTPEPTAGALLADFGDITIVGLGSAATRIKWAAAEVGGVIDASRRFQSSARTLHLQGLVISHGSGGCVKSQTGSIDYDQLILDDVIIESCTGFSALNIQNTHLTMTDSKIRNNAIATGGGAGINIAGSITMLTSNVQITGNLSDYSGGGVRITAIPGFGQSDVSWVDDGRSVVSGNYAGLDGGGVHVGGVASSLQLATVSTAPIQQRLTIRDNVAGGSGGGLYLQSSHLVDNRLDRIRIAGNSAAKGGGVAIYARTQIVASEIANNSATNDGGGVLIEIDGPRRSLQQVALRGNQAGGGGGAIATSNCSDFEAVDVSFDGNRAAFGRGQAIETAGGAILRHVTVRGNGSNSSPGLRKTYHTICATEKLRIANSLVTDNCSVVVSGGIVSDGGNQYGAKAGACPALHSDRRQTDDSVFGLNLGAYGGAFDVWGWGPALGFATRPQRNFGLAANCTSIDVRGLPRDSRCDSGAFEQQ